jgi:murein DD-endopeptidase MepM/ murein hydrolase activator NlpD
MAQNAAKRMWTAFVNKMKERYQFVVFNNQTLEQTGTYTYTVGRIAAFVLGMFALVVLATMAVVLYTPVREWIPGHYSTAENQSRMEEMMRRLSEMQYRVARQDSQIKSFQRLSGYQVPDSLLNKPKAVRDCSAITPRYLPPPPKAEEGPMTLPAEKSAPSREKVVPSEQSSAAPVPAPAPNPYQDLHLFPPVDGFMTRGYEPENRHFAIDVSAPEGTPVRAVADGVVILAEYSVENGHVIAISHANNLVSFYKHNKVLARQVGSYVSAGEPIAFVGNSGENTTGPHLHFELWVAGQPVNPTRFLNYPSLNSPTTATTGYPPVLMAVYLPFPRIY